MPQQVDPYTNHGGSKHVRENDPNAHSPQRQVDIGRVVVAVPIASCLLYVLQLSELARNPTHDSEVSLGRVVGIGLLTSSCGVCMSEASAKRQGTLTVSEMRPVMIVRTLWEAVICDDP